MTHLVELPDQLPVLRSLDKLLLKEKNFHSPNLDIRSLEGNISYLGFEGVDELPEVGEQGAHPEDPAGSIRKVPDVNGQWCAVSHQDSKQLF